MLCLLAMDNFEFVYELNRAVNALNSYVDACIASKSGLTRAQCVALMLIERFPDITKSELARKLNCSHVAAGRLVAILVGKNYISDTPSERNQHIVYLHVTHAGKDIIERIKEVFGQQSADLFAHVETKVNVPILSEQLGIFTDILSLYKIRA